MAHPARVVANEFIRLGVAQRSPLTPLQIMKLVYLAHGWMLAVYDEALVKETFEAWRYGPVVPDLYNAMKIYEADPVSEPLELGQTVRVGPSGRITFIPVIAEPFTERQGRIIDATYNHYGSWTASRLVQITHRPGSPWHRVWRREGWGLQLKDRQIGKFFKAQLA